MTRVGESPRQRDNGPSWRAILRSPSRVDVYDLRCSTTHGCGDVIVDVGADALDVAVGGGWFTRQNCVCAFSPIQKTSRQHAVTPRLGGRCRKKVRGDGETDVSVVGCGDVGSEARITGVCA